ncbi:MAG TPA: hypothetical protein DCZ92_15175 [Elusimicrobia bacterium]|nr:MAG: hypothetical protein A2016_03235 [Elusimicrobia bacterium GWF2_62_30]HBA62122.1 hypothetical protein [Elusimicrobiota bacterium]
MNAVIINLNLAVDKTALIPELEKGRVYRFPNAITMPGGKGVNVARALRAFGMDSPLAGFVSGYNGRWITKSLEEQGFRLFVERHEGGESRICYTVVDKSGRSIDMNENGPAVPAVNQGRFLKRFSRIVSGFRVAAICGKASTGLKKGFYSSLVRAAAAHGCFTIFDTSGPPLQEALAAGAEGIKINRFEFEELSGGPFNPHRLAAFFRRHTPKGLKTLMVTDGPAHAYAVSPFGLWRISPPRLARLKSPTGAGDSFMAGFLFGFLKGYDFEHTLKLASGAAASDCLSLGAGLINRAQALAFAQKTRVTRLG